MHPLSPPPEERLLGLVVVVATLSSVAFVVLFLAVTGRVVEGFDLGVTVFLLVFLIADAVFAAILLRAWLARLRFPVPQVWVSAHPLRVGEEARWRYVQRFSRPLGPEVEAWMQLVFREEATYQRGTETVTVTHEDVVDEWPLDLTGAQAGEVELEGRLQIPREGMHTFRARRNRLRWFLRVRAQIPNWPDFQRAYELTVLPEVVPAGGEG